MWISCSIKDDYRKNTAKEANSSLVKFINIWKEDHFLEKRPLCSHFPLPQMTAHFSLKQVPGALSLYTPLLIVLCTFIILFTETVKNHCLFWEYCVHLSVKRKRTISFHWEFDVVTGLVGQPKREKFSFRSYPSLFRELKAQIELSSGERRHSSHASPLPFSLLQRNWFAYTFPCELCMRLLLTDAIWKSDWRGKSSTLIRHCLCGLEQSKTLHFWWKDDPGGIAVPF